MDLPDKYRTGSDLFMKEMSSSMSWAMGVVGKLDAIVHGC